MKTIVEISDAKWDQVFPVAVTNEMTSALENGSVVMLRGLEFALSTEEKKLVDPRILGKAKNVSYTPWTNKLGGTVCTGAEAETLRALIARYSAASHKLMLNLFPHYQAGLKLGRTSMRPAEIAGRKSSWRKDDSRLHVDAFPTMPTYGERIVRMFCNVNPHGKPRVWRLGEPFEDVAKHFLPGINPPFPGSAQVLHWLHLTKKRRSAYDHYMLRLHDSMKSNLAYQQRVGQTPVEIVPGTTWITFTDSVSHAALAGQHQFEQTFNLPVNGMLDVNKSPLRILERLTARPLI